MNWQNIIEQTLVLLFPIAIVFLFVYYMLKAFFNEFDQKRKHELKSMYSKELLPLRLQAYERMVLFLERISPESMLLRLNQPGMKTIDIHRILLENIREEYEHNLSQQIYVSEEAWKMVVSARQSMVQLVSNTAADNDPNASSTEFCTDLLNEFASINGNPVSLALQFLRNETRSFL